MKCGVLGVGLMLAAQGCDGRAIEYAGHGGSSVDAGGDATSDTPSGMDGSSGAGSGGSSGPGPDAGDGGTCPSNPLSAGQSCSPDGEKCHYTVAGQGATDCGCLGGTWQCFSGCSGVTTNVTVDPALCAPQLKSTTICTPFSPVCSFTFDVPCWGDAGMPVGELDAGLNQGTAWCRAVAPPDAPAPTQCLRLNLVAGADGGTSLVGVCGGCGF